MDFIDQIRELAERARKQEEVLENNEVATIKLKSICLAYDGTNSE